MRRERSGLPQTQQDAPGAETEQPTGSRRAAGALESAVLAVLWQASEPLSPGEVRERLGRDEALGGAELSYSTVVTILTRLHEKNALSRERDGRAYRYAPWPTRRGSPRAGSPSCSTGCATARPCSRASSRTSQSTTKDCCAICSTSGGTARAAGTRRSGCAC